MRCYICDYSETAPSEYNSRTSSNQKNRVVHTNGKPICIKCLEQAQDALAELNLEDEDDG